MKTRPYRPSDELYRAEQLAAERRLAERRAIIDARRKAVSVRPEKRRDGRRP